MLQWRRKRKTIMTAVCFSLCTVFVSFGDSGFSNVEITKALKASKQLNIQIDRNRLLTRSFLYQKFGDNRTSSYEFYHLLTTDSVWEGYIIVGYEQQTGNATVTNVDGIVALFAPDASRFIAPPLSSYSKEQIASFVSNIFYRYGSKLVQVLSFESFRDIPGGSEWLSENENSDLVRNFFTNQPECKGYFFMVWCKTNGLLLGWKVTQQDGRIVIDAENISSRVGGFEPDIHVKPPFLMKIYEPASRFYRRR